MSSTILDQLDAIEVRLDRIEHTLFPPPLRQRVSEGITSPKHRERVWQTLWAFTAVLLVLSWGVAAASGNYFHYTNDPAYFTVDTNAVLQDPYGVGEGAGSANEGNHVVYHGPIGPDRWQDLEAQGWPYARTRTLLAARYPSGLPNHYHHDAAAQLLPRGLTVEALDRLYAMGEGYGALPTTKG